MRILNRLFHKRVTTIKLIDNLYSIPIRSIHNVRLGDRRYKQIKNNNWLSNNNTNNDIQSVNDNLYSITQSDYDRLSDKLEIFKLKLDDLKPIHGHSIPSTPFTINYDASDTLYLCLKIILWLIRSGDFKSLLLAQSLFNHLNNTGFTKHINNNFNDATNLNNLNFIILNYSCLISLHYGKGDLALQYSSSLLKFSSSTEYKNNLLNTIINQFIIDGDALAINLLTNYLMKLDYQLPTTHFENLFNLLVELQDNSNLYKMYLKVKDFYILPQSSLLTISNHLSSQNLKSNHKAFILSLLDRNHFNTLPASTQSSILINCCKLNQSDMIKLVYPHLSSSQLSSTQSSNLTLSIIRILTKDKNNSENIKLASLIFDIYLKDSKPSDYNHVQLNALSRMCLYLGNSSASLAVFRHLLSRSVMPDLKDINLSLLSIAQNSPNQAFQLFNHALDRGLHPTSETYGTLINQFLKFHSFDLVDKLLIDLNERCIDPLPLLEIIIQFYLLVDRPFNHFLIKLDKSHYNKPSKSILLKCIDHSIKSKNINLSQLSYQLNLLAKYNHLTIYRRHSILLHLTVSHNLLNKSNHFNRPLLNIVESLFKYKIPNENLESMIIFIAIFSEFNNKIALLDCYKRICGKNLLRFHQITSILKENQLNLSENALLRLSTSLDQYNDRLSNQLISKQIQ